MDVFDAFEEAPYEFLKVSRGGVYGNVIQQSYSADGIIDIDGGMVSTNNQEAHQSNSLVYVKPNESFIDDITVDGKLKLVGNGVRAFDKDYEVVGYGVGRNQDDGEIEHYELTLQAADFSAYSEES